MELLKILGLVSILIITGCINQESDITEPAIKSEKELDQKEDCFEVSQRIWISLEVCIFPLADYSENAMVNNAYYVDVYGHSVMVKEVEDAAYYTFEARTVKVDGEIEPVIWYLYAGQRRAGRYVWIGKDLYYIKFSYRDIEKNVFYFKLYKRKFVGNHIELCDENARIKKTKCICYHKNGERKCENITISATFFYGNQRVDCSIYFDEGEYRAIIEEKDFQEFYGIDGKREVRIYFFTEKKKFAMVSEEYKEDRWIEVVYYIHTLFIKYHKPYEEEVLI